jgi:hypothetical protein
MVINYLNYKRGSTKAMPPKKGNCVAPSMPDENILGFHLGESLRSQINAFNKLIVRYNQ